MKIRLNSSRNRIIATVLILWTCSFVGILCYGLTRSDILEKKSKKSYVKSIISIFKNRITTLNPSSLKDLDSYSDYTKFGYSTNSRGELTFDLSDPVENWLTWGGEYPHVYLDTMNRHFPVEMTPQGRDAEIAKLKKYYYLAKNHESYLQRSIDDQINEYFILVSIFIFLPVVLLLLWKLGIMFIRWILHGSNLPVIENKNSSEQLHESKILASNINPPSTDSSTIQNINSSPSPIDIDDNKVTQTSDIKTSNSILSIGIFLIILLSAAIVKLYYPLIKFYIRNIFFR